MAALMEHWIAPDLLFDGHDLLEGRAVRLRGGVVSDLANAPQAASRIAGILAPGFVDLQVNGGGGVLLNAEPTREGMATIAAAHRRFGTVAILPTVITDHPDTLDRAVDAAIAAKGDPGIIGLHIEGPHIAPARRGTHAEHFVRRFDDRTMGALRRLRAANVRVMITLAPDVVPPEIIAQIAAMGCAVSLGHTDASAAEMEAGYAAGAVCATHLFNAMSPMLGRAPGAVGAALNSEQFAGIICDGHHVADEMVGLAIRARPRPDLTFLVSDAMATVGGPDHFELYGQTVTLRDGRLVNDEGSLAGAHVTQAEGVKRLIDRVGIAPAAALRMATSIPAACIRAPDLGGIEGRRIEDLIVLDRDMTYRGDLAGLLPMAHGDHAAE